MKNKNILLTVCMLLIISAFALGCSPAERPVPETAPNTQNIDQDRNRTIDETPLRNNEMDRNDRLDMDNELNIDDEIDMDNELDIDDNMEPNNRTNTDTPNNR